MLPQFVFGIDPTTCNIRTLDFKTTVVPEPHAASGWLLWWQPPRWGWWMKLDLPPPQHVGGGGGGAVGGRIGGAAPVRRLPDAESESPQSLPEPLESLLLSSTRLGGPRRHSASGDESDESLAE